MCCFEAIVYPFRPCFVVRHDLQTDVQTLTAPPPPPYLHYCFCAILSRYSQCLYCNPILANKSKKSSLFFTDWFIWNTFYGSTHVNINKKGKSKLCGLTRLICGHRWYGLFYIAVSCVCTNKTEKKKRTSCHTQASVDRLAGNVWHDVFWGSAAAAEVPCCCLTA